MASIDDLVTVQKNGVVAVNTLVQALIDFRTVYENNAGTSVVTNVASNAKIFDGSGRLVSISVIAAAAGGTIHDADTVANASTDNAIYAIPNNVGIVFLGIPITTGLIIKPASGSVVTAIYSEDA